MKVATVLESSLPISMVFRHSGMISVDSRKLMTSVSSIWGAQKMLIYIVIPCTWLQCEAC